MSTIDKPHQVTPPPSIEEEPSNDEATVAAAAATVLKKKKKRKGAFLFSSSSFSNKESRRVRKQQKMSNAKIIAALRQHPQYDSALTRHVLQFIDNGNSNTNADSISANYSRLRDEPRGTLPFRTNKQIIDEEANLRGVSCTVHDLVTNKVLWTDSSALEVKCNIHDRASMPLHVQRFLNDLLHRNWGRYGNLDRPRRVPPMVRWSVHGQLDTMADLDDILQCAHLCALATCRSQQQIQQQQQVQQVQLNWVDVWRSLLLVPAAQVPLIVPGVQLMPSNLDLTVPTTADLNIVLPYIRALLHSNVLQHVGTVLLTVQAFFNDEQHDVLQHVLQAISDAMDASDEVYTLCNEHVRIRLEVADRNPMPLPWGTSPLVTELDFTATCLMDPDHYVFIDSMLEQIVQACADEEQPSLLRHLSVKILPSDAYHDEGNACLIPDALSYAQLQTNGLFFSDLLGELRNLRSLRIDFNWCSKDSQNSLEQMIREESDFVERNHSCLMWYQDEQMDELEERQDDAIKMQEDDACRVIIYTDDEAQAIHDALQSLQDYSLCGMLLFDTQTRRVLPSSGREHCHAS